MPVEIKSKTAQGKATTTVKTPDGHEATTEEKVGQPALFTKPWVNVGVKTGLTKNLGNYESARIDVSIDIPCQHEEINEVYAWATQWVDDRLEERLAQISGDD